jgi:hypothetical protein
MASLFKSKKKGQQQGSGGSAHTPSPSGSLDRSHGAHMAAAGQSPLSAHTADSRRLQSSGGHSQKAANGHVGAVSTGPTLQGNAPPPQYPWSSRKLGNPNPFPRYGHATNALAGKEGDIYIFGGLVKELAKADLWIIRTSDLQATQVQTTGEFPSPRVGHAALLVGNAFIGTP